MLVVGAVTASARGRVGAGYLVGGATRSDAMGRQSYLSHGPLVYARWSVDLSYYLDLDFGAQWRHQFMPFPSGSIHPVSGDLPGDSRKILMAAYFDFE